MIINKKKTCPKCESDLEKEEHVLSDDGFIKVTPFYRCTFCKEEFYDLNELKKRDKE